MSAPPNPTLGLDRETLPPKKRDQRLDSPQKLSDAATFKVPYPYMSHNGLQTAHTGPAQPIPRRVPALYQPWAHTHTSSKAKTHIFSHTREQHSWAEWREFNPLFPAWDLPHHRGHFSGHHSEVRPPGLQPGNLYSPFKFRPVTLVSEENHGLGAGYRWEVPTSRKQWSLNTERHISGRHRGPYMKLRDIQMDHSHRGIRVNPTSLNTCLSHSPVEDQTHEDQLTYKQQTTRAVKHPFFGQSYSLLSSLKLSPGDNPTEECTSMGVKEGSATVSPILSSSQHSSASSSSSSSHRAPWLLPHFAAGSLIKLRDGRLKRVEDLKTEDFLLGSLACPDLRLSCCTVQSISPSASSPSLSRLLILLHDQHSQELVDVYVEYPFFVRGRGWSSCCPQRTAHLCGLQCRQLSVGDICLALTPMLSHRTPDSQPPPPATPEPDTSPWKAQGGWGPLKSPCPKAALTTQLPRALDRLTEGREEAEPTRKRHWSAPELSSPILCSDDGHYFD